MANRRLPNSEMSRGMAIDGMPPFTPISAAERILLGTIFLVTPVLVFFSIVGFEAL